MTKSPRFAFRLEKSEERCGFLKENIMIPQAPNHTTAAMAKNQILLISKKSFTLGMPIQHTEFDGGCKGKN